MPRGLRERYDALKGPADFLELTTLRQRRCTSTEGPLVQNARPGPILDQWAQEELRKMETLGKRRHESEGSPRSSRTRAATKREVPVPKRGAASDFAEDQAPPAPSCACYASAREERPHQARCPRKHHRCPAADRRQLPVR